MKRYLAVLFAVAAVAVPTAATAGNSGDGSEYGTQPGFAVATSHTECAGHGAFGAFGKDNNFAGGANGEATGLANSELCGNRQGNLP